MTAGGMVVPDLRAGFWTRFAALFIDVLLCSIVGEVLELLLGRFGYFLALFGTIAYFVWFEGGPRGGGYGKQFCGITIIDRASGGSIGYGRAAMRYVGRIVSTVVLLLGYFWMLWDAERQCWHDKFANDLVVPRRPRTDVY